MKPVAVAAGQHRPRPIPFHAMHQVKELSVERFSGTHTYTHTRRNQAETLTHIYTYIGTGGRTDG